MMLELIGNRVGNSRARRSVLAGVTLAATLLGTSAAMASAMCTDINSSYSTPTTLVPNSSLPQRTYTSADYEIGDVITVTVTAATTNQQAGVYVRGRGDFMLGGVDVLNPGAAWTQDVAVRV